MELREYFKIFKKQWRIFSAIWIGVLVLGLAIQWALPVMYKVEINLDITRSGYQDNTTDYRYDEFYRLQADERFADTVVRWIGSARIQEDIRSNAKEVNLRKIKAERLSSQMIKVTFLIKESNQAERITNSMGTVLNNKISELNKEQANPNWFKVLISRPVIAKYELALPKLIIVLILAGFFLGAWGVFIKHYWEK